MKQILLATAALVMWLGTNAQTTVTFNYTGTLQNFTVPPCVTSIHIEARGAQGGAVTVQSPFPQGGLGAIMTGDFTVNPGDNLSVIVGGRGISDPSSSGGGGGSGVNNGSTILIVAGGGGGVDFQDPSYVGQDATLGTSGVNGNGGDPGLGGTGGAAGGDHAYTSNDISRGGNGWLAGINGSQGVAGTSLNTTFTAGTWGLGGGGGGVGYGWCNCGGGGGGYSGGGSADINNSGGGGGSYSIGTNQVNSVGNTGDGIVVITYTPGVGVPTAPTGITGTTAVCEGSSLLSYSISPVGGATGYTWSVTGDATIVSGQNTTNVDIQPGTMTTTISVTADNACGSSTAATFVLTVQPAPVIGLGSDITQCGGTVTLDANNPGATYMWSDMSTNQTLVVSTSGTYSVNVTSAQGCGANDTINVTINANPVIFLGNDTSLCGGTILLDGQIAGATYMWSDMSTNQTLMVTSSGTYSVVVTDANGCSGTDAINVTVNTPPAVSASVPSLICLDDAIMTLNGGSPAGGTWTGPGVSGNNFDPMTAGAGTHQLTYTYTDVNGCTGFDTVSTFVDLCLGINSANGIAFTVSPNPNNGSFAVEFTSSQSNAVIELVDVTGRTVQTTTVSGTRTTVNCETQPSGVYFVRVTADGVTSVKKISVIR